MSTRYLSVAETAKLVRAALADKFPGVKFSVRSKSYSGGASIDISWIDGPTAEEVKNVSSKFEGATFDGMIDLKEYHRSIWNGEEVHFGADYIFENRSLSNGLFLKTVESVAKDFGWPMPEIKYSQWGNQNTNAYLAPMDYETEHWYRVALSSAKVG